MRPTERFILDKVRSTAPFTKMNMSMGKQPIGRHLSLQDADWTLSDPVQE